MQIQIRKVGKYRYLTYDSALGDVIYIGKIDERENWAIAFALLQGDIEQLKFLHLWKNLGTMKSIFKPKNREELEPLIDLALNPEPAIKNKEKYQKLVEKKRQLEEKQRQHHLEMEKEARRIFEANEGVLKGRYKFMEEEPPRKAIERK